MTAGQDGKDYRISCVLEVSKEASPKRLIVSLPYALSI